MSSVPEQHRKEAPSVVPCVVITVSDTRTMENDEGGRTLEALLCSAGHQVLQRRIIPDDPDAIRAVLHQFGGDDRVDAIFLTGGTGLGSRDHTYETVSSQFTRLIPGYGELFRMLSYEEIGAAAMLSRAAAGLIGRTLVVTTPGSPNGVRLAMERLILPELGHLIREAHR